jgi:ectoine hydroxylase-related dioxygenase (phytanoyl-CoA dioxygenase family)
LLPKPGNVIIIPGDLMHGVEANYSDEERISIGANYFLTGEVGTDRATKFKL